MVAVHNVVARGPRVSTSSVEVVIIVGAVAAEKTIATRQASLTVEDLVLAPVVPGLVLVGTDAMAGVDRGGGRPRTTVSTARDQVSVMVIDGVRDGSR